jgi:hypothetical protein
VVKTVACQDPIEAAVLEGQSCSVPDAPLEVIQLQTALSLTCLPDHRRCKVDAGHMLRLQRRGAGDNARATGYVQDSHFRPECRRGKGTSHSVGIGMDG